MAQIQLPEWRRRGKVSLCGILANSAGTQRGSIFRAIPARKKDHSIAIAFVYDKGLDTELFDFGAEFMELGQDHFRIECLHGIFRSLVRVDANTH